MVLKLLLFLLEQYILNYSINDPANRQAEIENEKSIGLDPKQIARAVAFAIDTPEDTDVNEIIIRPMGQAV